MRHLNPETLARIADGPTTETEAAHLAECGECRGELAALCAQGTALAALPDPAAPPEVWAGLEARLAASGTGARGIRLPRPALQAAAAVAIFAAGALAGARGGDGGAAPPEAAPIAPVATAAADPAESLREAEAAYLYALARWMESGGALPAEDPVGRLAALESILYTTRAALERAPQDPVLGGFYRTALAQREAMITQVDMTMEDEWY